MRIYEVTLKERVVGYFVVIGVVRIGIGLLMVVGIPNRTYASFQIPEVRILGPQSQPY